jgi:hypothetical protein
MLPWCWQKLCLSALIFLLLSTGAPLLAQQPAISTEIGEITALEQNGRVQIDIPLAGSAVKPRISRLTDPDRLVFDFAGAIPKSGYSRLAVNRHSVSAVRTALLGTDANGRITTRIVIDLSQRNAYETSAQAGKFIVTFLDSAAQPAIAASRPALIPAPPHPRRAEPKVSVPSANTNSLNNIAVNHADGKTTVTLQFSHTAKPRTMSLSDPKRFVLDFPGVVFGPDCKQPMALKVNSGSVTTVRSSLFREEPPVVRVVFDQDSAAHAPKLSFEGDKVVVQFADESATATRSQPAQIPVTRPVASKPVPTASAKNTASTTAAVPCVRAPQTRVASSPLSDPLQVRPSGAGTEANGRPAPAPSSTPTSATMKPEPLAGMSPGVPVIKFESGLLSVDAQNATLIDVLYAVGEKTGAQIQVPMADAMLDRVVLKIGPRKPREVLATMLEGSGYHYIIIENSSGNLDKVILTPK